LRRPRRRPARSIWKRSPRLPPAVRPLESNLAPVVIATIHPSAVLRAAGSPERTESMTQLVRDLEVAKRSMGRSTRGR
jgi:hypothetical protein